MSACEGRAIGSEIRQFSPEFLTVDSQPGQFQQNAAVFLQVKGLYIRIPVVVEVGFPLYQAQQEHLEGIAPATDLFRIVDPPVFESILLHLGRSIADPPGQLLDLAEPGVPGSSPVNQFYSRGIGTVPVTIIILGKEAEYRDGKQQKEEIFFRVHLAKG